MSTWNPCQFCGLRPRSRAEDKVELLTAHTTIFHSFNCHSRPDIQAFGKRPRQATVALGMKKTPFAGKFTTCLIHNRSLDFQQIPPAGRPNRLRKIPIPHGEILRTVIHRVSLPAFRRTPAAQSARLVENHHLPSRINQKPRRTNPGHPCPDYSHRFLFHGFIDYLIAR